MYLTKFPHIGGWNLCDRNDFLYFHGGVKFFSDYQSSLSNLHKHKKIHTQVFSSSWRIHFYPITQALLLILDHIGPFQTIFRPFWTISDHFLPFQTILDHFGPHQTILDHFRPFWTTSDHFRPFQTILDRFRQIWASHFYHRWNKVLTHAQVRGQLRNLNPNL